MAKADAASHENVSTLSFSLYQLAGGVAAYLAYRLLCLTKLRACFCRAASQHCAMTARMARSMWRHQWRPGAGSWQRWRRSVASNASAGRGRYNNNINNSSPYHLISVKTARAE